MNRKPVFVPSMLREYCSDFSEISVSATSVREALLELKQEHAALHACVVDETGTVRRHIHVFINSDFVCTQSDSGLDTVIKPQDTLTIWTAVSGG